MLRTILKLARDNRLKVDVNSKRHISYRGLKKALQNFLEPRRSLPYGHACQIGDPVLRTHAQPVDREIIESPEFQRLIKHLIDVMRTYKATGLSAPQIGLSYQIFVMEVTEKHLKDVEEVHRKVRKMEVIPLQVFVNPMIKIVDYAKILHGEECLSILGYSAVVPRAKTVSIEALDTSGKPFVWKADGWAARIVQHEMDHLQGKLYVDRMDSSTFSCTFWNRVNSRNGYVGLQYYPKFWLRRYI